MGVGQATELRNLQPVAQLRVDIPGEVTWTETALEGPGTSVQAKVGLEVTGAAESPVAHLEEMGIPVISALQLAQGHPLHPHPSWKHLP